MTRFSLQATHLRSLASRAPIDGQCARKVAHHFEDELCFSDQAEQAFEIVFLGLRISSSKPFIQRTRSRSIKQPIFEVVKRDTGRGVRHIERATKALS